MTTPSPDPHCIIGRSPLRKEGRDKVTGRARYIDDIPFDGLLHGRTVRSPVPHGRLRGIRFLDGVPWDEMVVVTAADVPGVNGVTLLDRSQPFLADDIVRHVTEPVVLLAHADRHLVEKARRHVALDIEPLPHVFDMVEALEGRVILHPPDNVFKEFRIHHGDPASAFGRADLVLEETYETASQEQLYIEPQGVVAVATAGEVTVQGSIQCPYYVQKALMPLFGLPADRVRIVQTETGGAFGGKEEYPNILSGHAALLSWKAGGRPVKMIYDRIEDLEATPKRHPSRTRVKAGFLRTGELVALEIDFLLNGGAYMTLSPVVLSRGMLHSFGPYRCLNVDVLARAIATNCFPFGAFRGFGAPQSVFAIELHLSRAASELGLDPAELRRRNFLVPGDVMPTGQVVRESIDLGGLMDRALTESDYATKRLRFQEENRKPAGPRRGIGLSTFFHGSGFTGDGEVMLASRVGLKVLPDGIVEVLTANVEYGQGTNTVLSAIAAESLGLPYESVRVHQPDTGIVPDSGPTVASRTTMIIGRLVQQACEQMLEILRTEDDLPTGHDAADFLGAARRHLDRHPSLAVETAYRKPAGVTWDASTYRGEPYSAYAWCCDVAVVEVDPVSHEIRLVDFVSVVECGTVIHPLLARGQIEGGIAQAVGQALYEDVVLANGVMANHHYTNYIIPTTADTPDIRVFFVEFPPSGHGPFAAKGIGELPADGPAAAIAHAVAHALGDTYINHVPIFPEHVLRRLKDRTG